MKTMRKAFVKTVVLGKRGKSTISTQLSVDLNSASLKKPSTRTDDSSHIDESMYGLQEDSQTCHELNTVDDIENEESAAQKRNINSYINWEKIRPVLLKAKFEDESFPNGVVCSGCSENEANIRYQHCGPRPYFCHSCAMDQHKSQNQFHVMDKWMVLFIILCRYCSVTQL